MEYFYVRQCNSWVDITPISRRTPPSISKCLLIKHGGVRGLVSKIFKNPSKIALEIPINASKFQIFSRLRRALLPSPPSTRRRRRKFCVLYLCKGRFPLYKAPQAKFLWYCTSVKVDFPLYKAPQAKKMMYCDSVKVDFPFIKRRRRKFWGIVPL